MNDDHVGVLLEKIVDQNQAVLEAVSDMQQKINQLPTRDEFTELKNDVQVIKAAVTDMSQQLNDHEQRITTLETKVA